MVIYPSTGRHTTSADLTYWLTAVIQHHRSTSQNSCLSVSKRNIYVYTRQVLLVQQPSAPAAMWVEVYQRCNRFSKQSWHSASTSVFGDQTVTLPNEQLCALFEARLRSFSSLDTELRFKQCFHMRTHFEWVTSCLTCNYHSLQLQTVLLCLQSQANVKRQSWTVRNKRQGILACFICWVDIKHISCQITFA